MGEWVNLKVITMSSTYISAYIGVVYKVCMWFDIAS